jgi:hemolysin D
MIKKTIPAVEPGQQRRIPSRILDPLHLLRIEGPSQLSRIVLWIILALCIVATIWALVGRLDIVVSAEGKLVPQSLVKSVQPAEAGIVKRILVKEGDLVSEGQLLLQLDKTLVSSDRIGLDAEWAFLKLQARRIQAEISNTTFNAKPEEDSASFAQINSLLNSRRRSHQDSLAHERSLLDKAEAEHRGAEANLVKLNQSLGSYQQSAQAFRQLEKDGFVGPLAAAEKAREASEKQNDIEVQKANLQSLKATIVAQEKRIRQIQSSYESDLQRELSEVRSKLMPMGSTVAKSEYREKLMELKAPQAGIVKDLATTTEGAVVQPGGVLLTLVPQGEPLFADVMIRNEDIGFIQVGQKVQVKVSTFPFQKYALLQGRVDRISADAANDMETGSQGPRIPEAPRFKARIEIPKDIRAEWEKRTKLELGSGMQVVAEINQGTRTVFEYLLSPVSKGMAEAARER